jgi:signal transduction histidine kinase
MHLPSLRLHHRIVLPVVLVAFITSSLSAIISLTLIRRSLEGRVVDQLAHTATAVSQSEFALNEAILGRVRDITGADVVTFVPGGAIIASSLERSAHAELLATVTGDHSVVSAKPGETLLYQQTCEGVPCYVAYRRVIGRPGTVVALVEQTSELAAATQGVTRTILLSTGLGLLALVLVGQAVARRVTGPLERLVDFTNNVSAGGTRGRAAVADHEIGRLAAAFNGMLDRAEQAQDALVRSEKLALAGLLAARVAHDVRNPLSSIKMQAQLLRPRLTTDEARQMLQALLHDVDSVEGVVRGLLELAKPGDVTLTCQPLNEVVREVLDHLASQLAHRKISVDRRLDPAIPDVPLDVDRFKQALLNVIANATEAMPSGGTLTVATRLTADATAVVLEVSDDGTGVDPAIEGRVFDPFVSTKREGVGLGLVNTRSIVESHGGRIELIGRHPRGTCVTMSVPIASATDPIAPRAHG